MAFVTATSALCMWQLVEPLPSPTSHASRLSMTHTSSYIHTFTEKMT